MFVRAARVRGSIFSANEFGGGCNALVVLDNSVYGNTLLKKSDVLDRLCRYSTLL